ncbi:MAG: DUF1573 domain-containing protein [Oscillibacter sp.]|nr:DUF1573 domain-containing protein [Oscillibacter sp.]
MKKLLPAILILAVIIISGVEWMLIHKVYGSLEKEALTEVRFTDKIIHLGEVSLDSCKHAEFEIKNTGRVPLLIKAVEPSCGCTSVKWNRHPIEPEQTGKISIRFEPFSIGKFSKSVLLYCNTKQEVHTLKFDGYVKE